MENMFADTEELFSEVNENDNKVETVSASHTENKVEYIAEVLEGWQVRRYNKGTIGKAFEVLDSYKFDPQTNKRYDEIAKKRGQLLGNNTVVEMFKKVYVCEWSGNNKAHKGERIIGENGTKVEQKCTVYKKFNGRRY